MKTRNLITMLAALLLAAAAGGGFADAASDDDDSTGTDADAEAVGEECSPDQLETVEPGQLTIATGDPAFPPWVENDDPYSGEGFEAAVAYAVAEELGFDAEDVEWVRTGFDEAIAPGDKPYDFNMQQYSITEERAEVVDFSIPYYREQKALVALEDSSAADATTFDDLADARFGATIGTTDLDYIERELGITDAAVYDTQADTIAAMQAGQIDATVVGLSVAYFLTAVQVEDAVIVGVLPDAETAAEDEVEGTAAEDEDAETTEDAGTLPEDEDADTTEDEVDGTAPEDDDDAEGAGEGMGMLFTKGSPLVPCVNAALQALHDDGTLEELAVEWLQQGGDIPEITR